MKILKVISDEASGQSFKLSPGVTAVGRLDDNQVQISHPTVSSHHCELRLGDGGLIVKDLGSTNGTFINDQPVAAEGVLHPGDILRLGDVRLAFEAADSVIAFCCHSGLKKNFADRSLPCNSSPSGRPLARSNAFIPVPE